MNSKLCDSSLVLVVSGGMDADLGCYLGVGVGCSVLVCASTLIVKDLYNKIYRVCASAIISSLMFITFSSFNYVEIVTL